MTPTTRRLLAFAVAVALVLGLAGAVVYITRRPPKLAPGAGAAAVAGLEAKLNQGQATPLERVQLAEIYLEQGETLKAGDLALQARKADPRLTAAHDLLGRIYAQIKDVPKARAAFEEAVNTAPDQVAPRLQLARFEMDQNELQRALASLQKAVEINRDSAETWLLVGKLQRLSHAETAAGTSFRRAIKLDPKLLEAQVNLGVLELDFDRYSEAVAPLDAAYQLGDRTPVTLSCLALALLAGPGKDTDAQRAGELLAQAGQPEIPPAWVARGLLLQRNRDHQGAVREFQKVLRVNPRNERAQFALAESYRQAGDVDAATKALARHHQLVTQRQQLRALGDRIKNEGAKPPLLREYGKLLLEADQFNEAEAQFRYWLKLEPNNAEPRQWLQKVETRRRAEVRS